MARIISLVPSRKGAFRRAKGERNRLEEQGQMNLFLDQPARVVRLQTMQSPFEEALLLDRRGSMAAREAYERAVKAGNRTADAACNLGILCASTGEGDEAIEWFSTALAAEPEHLEAHYNLGCLYLDLEMFAPARVHLGVAVAQDPSSSELHFNLAVALAAVGQLAGAADALRKYRMLAGAEDDAGADRLLKDLEKALRERA